MDVAATYDRAAPTWGATVRRLGYGAAYGALFEGRTRPSGAVLDVGTGSGVFADAWVRAGGSADLTLLDPSAKMLDQAHGHFQQRGISADLAHCGLLDYAPQSSFDAVLAAHVLEHFSDPSAALAHLAACLAEGGQLYLVVSKPHWCNWLIWLRFRHNWFSQRHVCFMATAAGLALVRTHIFHTGPPSRTSFGYVFSKPRKEI